MERIAIVFGSNDGNTEDAARRISELLKDREHDLLDVRASGVETLQEYDVLLVGASTWYIGELQDDWDVNFPKLDGLDFSGTRVAFFGAGDSSGYPDNFLDSLGILWEKFSELGASLVGTWPSEDYDFIESRALMESGNEFVGLGIDNDNEGEKTLARIDAWVSKLRGDLEWASTAN
ncbi:MAG: flavodoxin [Acidobacteriota bacterium]